MRRCRAWRARRRCPHPPARQRRLRLTLRACAALFLLAAGSHIVLVRSEELCISGNIHRNKQKWAEAANKKSNTNPT
jgi:hypothetical protein